MAQLLALDAEAAVDQQYRDGLRAQIGRVLDANPRFYDHRRQHPWLTGALGDPEAGVWFVAENPSLGQVEKVQDPEGGAPTEEAQWWASRGDKLFRDNLVTQGFKDPPASSHGGWHCYITNVIKEADYAERWKGSPASRRREAALAWRPVIEWELANSRPLVVVALGKTVAGILDVLESRGVKLRGRMTIQHYAYVAHRPRGKQGPMHPERVAEYASEFVEVRRVLESRRTRV